MNFKPLRKNVLIAEKRKDFVSDAGLVVESSNVVDSTIGVVLAVGGDVTMVHINNHVLVDWKKATIVKVNGVQRVVINEDDIMAVLL